MGKIANRNGQSNTFVNNIQKPRVHEYSVDILIQRHWRLQLLGRLQKIKNMFNCLFNCSEIPNGSLLSNYDKILKCLIFAFPNKFKLVCLHDKSVCLNDLLLNFHVCLYA